MNYLFGLNYLSRIMNVKVKKLVEGVELPKYAHLTDAGMDLVATSYEYNEVMNAHIYGTGLAFEIPEGYVGLLFPRSSIRKVDGILTNHVGIIDSGYRGEVMATFKNYDRDPYAIKELVKPYEVGDKICQLIIMPYPKINLVEAEELSDSDRGSNGHGSTGK